jgi:AraC-like DNA-binding protein
MTIPREVLILLSSIGAIQSYFLSYTFFRSKNKQPLVNNLLSALFFFIALRVTKSVLWMFWEGTPNWLINFGFASHAMVGPLLLLYIFYSLEDDRSFGIMNYFHFLPAVLIFLLSFNLTLNSFWYAYGYTILLYHQLAYVIASVIILYRNPGRNKETDFSKTNMLWLKILCFGIAVWDIAYFTNYVLGWTSYLLGPVLYSAIVYIISFFVYRNQKIFEEPAKPEKYKNINLSNGEIKNYINRIVTKIESENLYLDVNLTLTRLSEKVMLPTYVISQVLNINMGKNFAEFINSYRIEKAKILLKSNNGKIFKISDIAHQSGFNSLSAFNSAFKKNTNLTPSQFKLQD